MKNRRTHAIVASLVTSSLAGAALIGIASPAAAAVTQVSTAAELESAIVAANANPDADTISITANISAADLMLDVTSPLTIDVNAFRVENVRVRATADLTLVGPGSWATGGSSLDPDRPRYPGLGIGPNATLTIDGLIVQARGTMCDAAIGGWNLAPSGCNALNAFGGGTINIVDSTITAASTSSTAIGSNFGGLSNISIVRSVVNAGAENGGAAIGGHSFYAPAPGSTGSITIIDSSVTARNAERQSAAIGAGRFGVTGPIHVSGSTINTRDSGGTGIGNGSDFDPAATPGTLTVSSSTLDVSGVSAPTTISPALTPAHTGVTIARGAWIYFRNGLVNNGVIEIKEDSRLDAGEPVINNGTIFPASSVYAPDVEVNAFSVLFDENPAPGWGLYPERVYAANMSDAGSTVRPPYGLNPGKVFTSWNSEIGGTSIPFTATTALAPIAAADGALTVYAQWIDDFVEVAPATMTLTAGDTQTFTSTAPVTGGGVADVSTSAVLTSSEASDVISGADVTFTKAGTRTITTTHRGVTAAASVDVTADALAGLVLTPPASSVTQGGSLTLTVDGADRFGNDIVVDPSDVTLTSSVDTDEIDGLTVSFPHASPHTITATAGGVSASITIEVSPAATTDEPDDDGDAASAGDAAGVKPLAATGGPDAAPAVVTGALFLLLGATMYLLARRRVRRS